MPITDIDFSNGIYYAKETGYITREDAELWAKYARKFAAESPTPIVALVDALDVTAIANEARQIFVKAAKTPNLKISAIASNAPIPTTATRIIGMMVDKDHTNVFPTFEEALRFARQHAAYAHSS